MSFLLRFTPEIRHGLGYHTKHTAPFYFFVRLGEQWHNNPRLRYIDATTPDRSEARQFATEEEAREVLVVSGNSPVAGDAKGWTIEPV